MKVVTPEEEKAHYAVVKKGGLIGGSLGLALGLGGVMFASRRYPAFRGLTLPFRTFIVTSTGTFGAVVNAERHSVQFQKEHDPQAQYNDARRRAMSNDIARAESTSQRAIEWARENRYSIVFASWVASMGVAMALVGRSPMSTANKLVQARVYAQGLTLGVLIISAAFEVSDANKGNSRWQTVKVVDPNDPEHKHLIEKRIHKEEYEGQDLWMDMVAAEERRMEEKKKREDTRNKA